MIIAPTEHEAATEDIDPAELLIKEARRRQRRRYLVLTLAILVVLAAALGLSTFRGGPKGLQTATGIPERSEPTTVPSMPLKSRIWTLDMLNAASGYAVAGVSSMKQDEQLIKTTNKGHSWSIVGTLPYSFEAGQYKPLLDFVTPSVGYTQAFRVGTKWASNNIYVTRDAGKSWSKLRILGRVPSALDSVADASTSPDFRVSKGTLSLLSLDCTIANSNGACPATLSEYHSGATRPFTSHRVGLVGPSPKASSVNTYLLEAPSESTALVAEGETAAGPFRLSLTTNAGASWSIVSSPCKQYPREPGLSISGVSLTPSRWILNCSQGTGMNHANVLLSETTNDGRTWSTINYTPAWSAKTGAIASEMDQVWASNEGKVLWSYSMVGFVQVSTNGGRTWSLIKVNGKVLNSSIFGGWPIEFDPVGPSGAYFMTKTGQVLLSRDGANFTPIRLLRQIREDK